MNEVIDDLIIRYPALSYMRQDLINAVDIMEYSIQRLGKKIIVCGNGGSASDSEHIVGELMKSFRKKRPVDKVKMMHGDLPFELIENLEQPISAISLVSGVALPTAFSNDVNGKFCFAQQVLGLGKENDILIGITTSGKSENVIYAFQLAKFLGIKTIALTRKDYSPICDYSDIVLGVPETETYKIQEYHLPVYHCLCAELENRIFN